MRKRVWFCLALAILFVCLIGVIAGCNPDDTDKNTTAPLAGKFVNDSYYWLDLDTYVITHTLEYFSDGTAQMRVTGYFVSTGKPYNLTLNGTYSWKKDDTIVSCVWTEPTVAEYIYTGTEINTGYAVLSCVGRNSLGEFEGLYNLVSYGTSGPGNIEGDVMQFVSDGKSAQTVTAVPSVGAEFVRWSDGITTPKRTDNSVSGNISVFAEFRKVADVFSLNYSAEAGGTIQGETSQEVLIYGSGTEVTAVPNEGYGFIKWSDGVTTATRTDTNVKQNLSVTAEFGRKKTVSYSAGEGGTIQGEATQELIAGIEGTPVTAVPNDGWYFVGWSDGVETPTRTYTPSAYGISTVSIEATFAPYHKVNYIVYGTGGTIQGEATQLVKPGETPTAVTAVPDEGYKLTGWYEEGVSTGNQIVGAEETFSGGQVLYYGDGTTTYYVAFEPIEYVCIYYADKGGTVNGSANRYDSIATVHTGYATAEIVAVPNSGYVFTGWSDGRKDNPRIDTIDPDNPQTVMVTAHFAIGFTLTYTADAGGTISGVSIQGIPTGEDGTEVTAVPNAGCSFVRWSDGVMTATRKDTNVTSDLSVTAEFLRGTFTLSYFAGEGGTIEGTTEQSVLAGDSGTAVTAVPNDGWYFVGWSDGVMTAIRTDIEITSDINVTAEFDVIGNIVDFAGGNGTTENPYQIANVRHLRNMELYPSANFVLTADITLSEVSAGDSNFAPMFSDENPFMGTFNGAEHKIINLTVYNTETFYSGLFSVIGSTGCVKNLTLENASVSGTNYAGIIAGWSLGSITDCTVSGEVERLAANGYKVFVGGIAGRAEGNVNGCSSSVNLTVSEANADTYAGGIVGYLSFKSSSSSPLTLSASGNASISCGGSVYVGGLAGYTSSTLYLSKCYTEMQITSTTSSSRSAYAGGLVGYGGSVTISDSYATGDVTATSIDSYSSAYAGGLVGYGDNSVTISDSYATGDVTATNNLTSSSNSSAYAGGLVGYGSSVTISDSYATGDVTATSNGSHVSRGAYVGGLVGYGSSVTISDSYATGAVTATDNSTFDSYAYAGGLVGYCYSNVTISDSYATGAVTATSSDITYAGGLVGYCDNNVTIGDSYATGDVTATSSSYSAYAGGLVGRANGSVTIRNSYSSSLLSAEGKTAYAGGLTGYVSDSVSLENAHWLKSADTDAVYAIGYSNSLGVPTSIGSTSHALIEEFYTLADTLNAGREVPVWEHTGENTLPSLISGEGELVE